MHIYIDESGQFIPLDGAKSRAAATLALVVPSASQVALRRKFRNLKRELGADGAELKGSQLEEGDVARVVALLAEYEVIAEAVVLDAGNHADGEVTAFKAHQAERLMANIGRGHQPGLIQDLIHLQGTILTLPNQLFLQAFCMWQLIPRLVETATMYFAQRRPIELGSFVWRVDAKDASVTKMESLWKVLIGPIITAESADKPMGMIPGADYSFYQRFDMVAPDQSVRRAGHFYTDMKKLLHEDFAFRPSVADLGLQMADIAVAALTRALNGTLRQDGWQSLGSLFIRRSAGAVRLIALSTADEGTSRLVENPRWRAVMRRLDASARSMLTKHTLEDEVDAGS